MSIFLCLKGHKSTESDYCSECGVKINGIAELAAKVNVTTTTATAEICPDCSTPREPDTGDFCEICGYNFTSGAHGEVPIAITHPPIQQVEITQKQEQLSVVQWEIVVTIDAHIRHLDSPEPPINQPPIIFTLDKTTHLIGRNSQVRAIHPEIALDFDDAISHRHALLNRQPDGSFTLRDIGSANGTQFQGVELKPMVDIPLKNGDEFTLGHWTRITLKAMQQ
jgi:hypothetical protein